MASTFLLVHGGWHGAWCWSKLTPLLEQAGHRVIAPDLPAHGRDTTPLSDRPWERYVKCVRDVVEAEQGRVILVGHSSGGMIISAVAEELPERVAALVYLAAFLLPKGVTPPEITRADAETLVPSSMVIDLERKVMTIIPERARDVFYHDCSDEDAAWATRQLVPEAMVPPQAPNAPDTKKSNPPSGGADAVPRAYIECLQDRALGPATQRRMYEATPCRVVYSLPTSHSPFLSAPEQLAAHLVDIAAWSSA